MNFSAECLVGLYRRASAVSAAPQVGAARRNCVVVRQVRKAPRVLIVDPSVAAVRAKTWEPRFNAAGLAISLGQSDSGNTITPAVT